MILTKQKKAKMSKNGRNIYNMAPVSPLLFPSVQGLNLLLKVVRQHFHLQCAWIYVPREMHVANLVDKL